MTSLTAPHTGPIDNGLDSAAEVMYVCGYVLRMDDGVSMRPAQQTPPRNGGFLVRCW